MFAKQFKKVRRLSYSDKQRVVDVLVDRIEVTDNEQERRAKVFFRFDPMAITGAIPVGRTDVIPSESGKHGNDPLKKGVMVGRAGFEPAANALKGHCSTS